MTLWQMLLGLAAVPFVWLGVHRALSPFRTVNLRQLDLPGDNKQDSPGRLRIGAFNIAHGLNHDQTRLRRPPRQVIQRRLEQMADLLAESRLDLLVLNEVDFDSVRTHGLNQAEIIARRAGFPFLVEQTNVDAALPGVRIRTGNALLSRYPLTDSRVIPFPGHHLIETLFWGKKNGLLCTVTLKETYRFELLAVHLEHRLETVRFQAARAIDALRRTSALDLVAAGDFNSTLSHFPHAASHPSGITAFSWLLAQGDFKTLPMDGPAPEDLTFSSDRPLLVIDWILVPRHWRILDKQVLDRGLSDHRLVVMEVEVREKPEP